MAAIRHPHTLHRGAARPWLGLASGCTPASEVTALVVHEGFFLKAMGRGQASHRGTVSSARADTDITYLLVSHQYSTYSRVRPPQFLQEPDLREDWGTLPAEAGPNDTSVNL